MSPKSTENTSEDGKRLTFCFSRVLSLVCSVLLILKSHTHTPRSLPQTQCSAHTYGTHTHCVATGANSEENRALQVLEMQDHLFGRTRGKGSEGSMDPWTDWEKQKSQGLGHTLYSTFMPVEIHTVLQPLSPTLSYTRVI